MPDPQHLAAFLAQLHFRRSPPQTEFQLNLNEPPESWQEDWENPDFGLWDASLRQVLEPLRSIPRMSTLTIAGLLNYCVTQMPRSQAYLNIGTWQGFSLFAGLLGHPDKTCLGVDNFSQFQQPDQQQQFEARFAALRSPQHHFYVQDYQDFLKDYDAHQHGQIGVYFYDGDHSYAEQLENLEQIDPLLAPGALVLIDDTNWFYALQATKDFILSQNGRYQLLCHLPTACNYHPSFWNGITILYKVP